MWEETDKERAPRSQGSFWKATAKHLTSEAQLGLLISRHWLHFYTEHIKPVVNAWCIFLKLDWEVRFPHDCSISMKSVHHSTWGKKGRHIILWTKFKLQFLEKEQEEEGMAVAAMAGSHKVTQTDLELTL